VSELSADAKRELLERLLRERVARRQADRAETTANGGPRTTAAALRPIPRDGELPLSFGQERIWFLEELHPGSPVYHLLVCLRLTGRLDLDALGRSLETVASRHEALRTVFPTVDGRPVQRITTPAPWPLPVRDLRALPAGAREAEGRRLTAAEARVVFDLARGPLMKTTLYRLADDEHVLSLTVHHIVFDGWSLRPLLEELVACYGALVAGQAPVLPELTVQYADFAAWQRRWLTGDVLEAQRAYWLRRLGGELPVLDLPADRARPVTLTFEGATRTMVVDPAVRDGLRELSRREGVTLFVTLLAAFKTLLLRYSGQDDVIVGAPVAGRMRPEVERLIGFFVNTLVLRTDLGGDPPFREALRRVRDTVIGGQAHPDFPFERLVEELQPERDLTRSPLFQVLFNMLSFGFGGELRAPGLSIQQLPSLDLLSTSDGLTLYGIEAPDRLETCFIYSPDVFDADTIARLERHFHTLLAGIVADPDRPLSALPLLPEDERHRLLVAWNATDVALPLDAPFARQFQAQVARTPEAIAVVADEGTLTYAELAARVDRLAGVLAGAGIGPDRVVALLAERSLDLLTWMLAVFRAGGAYLPLDPHHPPARHAAILSASRAGVVVVADGLAVLLEAALAELDERGRPTVLSASALRVLPPAPAPAPRGRPADLAYVIYTSGSTGVPKGAMVEQLGMLNHLHAKIRDLGLTGADTVAQTASQCFDISVWQFLAPLLVGGRVRIVADDVAHDATRLLDLVSREAVSILEVVPSLLASTLEDGDDGLIGRPSLRALRWLIVTGEALPPTLCRRWLRVYPGIPLLNGYGPTECSDDVTHHLITAPPVDGVTHVPIGRPIANTRIYVLDRRLEPVPVGIAGELCVGGFGVGRGYLNDPARTAEVFLDDPFADRPGARLYRTGDLARWRPDGTLQFLGRLDHQVKIRGFRVELGEIEATLTRHPAVRDVVVTAREDGRAGRRLVAYLVVTGEAPPPAELRAFLARTVPDYMVPDVFVVLPALPVTPNGKVDRRALPAPVWSARPEMAVRPFTPTEEVIANVWADVLGIERVGLDDTFFEVGGHSLLATRVVSRLRQAFGIDLPVRRLFEAPTVAGLAAHVQTARGAGAPAAAPPIRPITRTDVAPLSFAQERLWFLDRFEPGSTAFNMGVSLRLAGPLDRAALQRSLEEIWCRHESLRTTFDELDGRPVQRITPPGALPLPVIDLGHLADPGRRVELERRAVELAQRPFDLMRGPLTRVQLFRLADTEHVLVVAAHHIVVDGWSFGVLVRELSALYSAFARGAPSPLAELPVQYADYADWQRRSLEGTGPKSSLDYWRRALAGSSSLAVPTDRPRSARQTFRGAGVPLAVSAEVSAALRALGRREGATLFMTLLAALEALLARHAGCEDVVVGAPVAGRTRPETEPLIGFFLNTLALRADLSGDPTFGEILARVRAGVLGALANQDLPFEKVVEALRPERDLSRTPLFQVFFNLLDFPREAMPPGSDLAISPLTADLQSLALDLPAKFDLSLYASDQPDGIRLFLLYNADLFEATTAATLVRQLERVLAAVATAPGTRLSALPLVSDAERAALVLRPRRPFAAFPPRASAGTIVDRFATIAPRHAEQPAIESRGAVWTYRELDALVRRLARAVRAAVGGDGGRVGLLLEHDAPMVAAMLGVLASGHAYVPLDPFYPRERLAFMLADAEAALLVTSGRHVELARALAGESLRVLSLDDLPPADPHAVVPPVAPDAVAYILYTSGSTGQPKGVVQSHRNVLHHIGAYTNNLHIGPGDRLGQLASFSFDAAVMDMFGALLNGATLCLWDVREAGLARLPEWLRDARITIYHSTPTLYRALLASLAGGDTFPGVRLVVLGGEEVVRRDVELYRRHFPGDCLFVNGLGPTESTVSFQHVLDHLSLVTGPSVPVGFAVAETELVLLDPAGRPAPLAGEIGIRSAHVALGYWRRPELTAAAFLADPAGGERRIYRTGDLGRLRPDGTLEFIGRRDDQIKVRGFRIEPGEVESVLEAHPEVRRSVVVAREGGAGERYLVAYVVPARAPAPPAGTLQAFVRERLPAYMVPSVVVTLDALPLTPSGKVDRRALPAPGLVGRPGGGAGTPPRTPTERAVAAIWSEVLGIESIGVDDSFFELGGHSLLATRVLARVRDRLQAELPLRALFESPTVAALATLVDASGGPPAAPVAREEIEL
jgi:amino acid adenylation domain-containing protein